MIIKQEYIRDTYRHTMRRTPPLTWLRWKLFGRISDRMANVFRDRLNKGPANWPPERAKSLNTARELLRGIRTGDESLGQG